MRRAGPQSLDALFQGDILVVLRLGLSRFPAILGVASRRASRMLCAPTA